MMQVWFIWLLLSISTVLQASEDFTVSRPIATSQSRQRLREMFAELLNDYLEVLIEDLSLISQRLLSDKMMSDIEIARAQQHIQNLYSLRVFLCTGDTAAAPVLPSKTLMRDMSLYAHIVDDIACTQKEIIKVLRALLERDAASCFVACKTKAQLERYIKKMRSCIDDTRVYTERLEVLVRMSKKIE